MSQKMPQANEDKVQCWGHYSNCAKCRKCELASPCQSKTDEPKENLKYQFQHISVPQVFFDGGEHGETENEELFEAANAYFSSIDEPEKEHHLVLDGITIPENVKMLVFQIVGRLAEFYFHTPDVFEAIMKNAFQGKSQSDIAREKFITRQCVNKRLLKDLGIAQKRNDIQERRDRELAEAKSNFERQTEELRQKDEFLCSLSERNWLIYKYHFIDGCSEESTANQVGCSRRTVSTVAQFLRENLDKNCTIIKRGRKKNGKNHKKNDPDCR